MEKSLINQVFTLGQMIEQCTLLARQIWKDASVENLKLLSKEELNEFDRELEITEKKVMKFIDVINLEDL